MKPDQLEFAQKARVFMRMHRGLELIQAVKDGSIINPFLRRTGIVISEVSAGHLKTNLHVTEDHCNYLGTGHGGVTVTMLDATIGMAIQTTLPAGRFATTIELSTSFLKAVEAGDDIYAISQEAQAGKTLGYAEAILYNGQHRKIATGHGRFSILDLD
jgi:uncharacterized protein (TIGR00369 family)